MVRFAAIMAVALLALAGLCAAQPDRPTNPTCPVMTGDPVDPAVFLDYEERRIWFADETARELFEFSPEDYLPNLPAVTPWVEARVLATDDAQSAMSIGARAFRFVTRLHPAFVHFPIALLVAAAMAEMLSLRWKRDALRAASAWCVVLAALGAFPAAVSGWLLAGGYDQAPAALDTHRWLGVATAVSAAISAGLLAYCARAKSPDTVRRFYLVSLVGGALLAGIAGHFGAILVYGADYLKF